MDIINTINTMHSPLEFRYTAEEKEWHIIRQKLIQQNQELEELYYFKSRLLSIVVHDLRAPLNNSLLSMRLFNEGTLTEQEAKQAALLIVENITQIKKMLDNLLTQFPKTLHGFHPEIIPIKPVLEETFSLYQALLAEKSISVELNTSMANLVVTNNSYLSLVLRNIIDNAVKFTPPNGRIIAGIAEWEYDYEIYISNTHEGISMDKATNILSGKKFALRPGMETESGMGLGLFFCREYLKSMNSHLSISQTNDEIIFSFRLTRHRVQTVPD